MCLSTLVRPAHRSSRIPALAACNLARRLATAICGVGLRLERARQIFPTATGFRVQQGSTGDERRDRRLHAFGGDAVHDYAVCAAVHVIA